MKRRKLPPVWPKTLPDLTPEQQAIREDFMKHWHEVLPQKYSVMEEINHKLALSDQAPPKNHQQKPCRTLEIGVGLGAHLHYEDFSWQDYVGLELRWSLARRVPRNKFPVKLLVGDLLAGLPVADGTFQRIVAIHVLEHLVDLPRALREIQRVMSADGHFTVVIPCEGGLAYELARTISAKRIFEKKYQCSYDWFVASEHVSTVPEILYELHQHFEVRWKRHLPCLVPVSDFNLVIGLQCHHKHKNEATL